MLKVSDGQRKNHMDFKKVKFILAGRCLALGVGVK